MREGMLASSPTIAVFLVMVMTAVTLAAALDPYGVTTGIEGQAATARAIVLPTPADDRDLDSYHDDVDLFDGDAMVRVEIVELALHDDDARPQVIIGTQDDHWRLGAGRELEWRHVVDPDPLGHRPGSPEWTVQNLRTGTWQVSPSMEDSGRAIANTHRLDTASAPNGSEWPLVFWVNVRDDAVEVTLDLSIIDAQPDPDVAVLSSTIKVDETVWTMQGIKAEHAETIELHADGVSLRLNVARTMDVSIEDRQTIMERWAPGLHFDASELFFPVQGDRLERFHGFTDRQPDWQTWSRNFNNGRDGYRLLTGDFDGNRIIDQNDVQLIWDILREGTRQDTVYSHVTMTTGDRVAVQYWFIYPYNFVIGDNGQSVVELAHAGDREFIQLLFQDVDEALQGTPSSITYSQHYHGVRIESPSMDAGAFVHGTPQVYVAGGSHASYPVAGDDERLRSSFAGYGDVFRGDGEHMTIEDYRLELLTGQPWHAGYLWGPITRHHRDLGIPGRPLLVHSFTYAWHDPVNWQNAIHAVDEERLQIRYGGESD